MLTVFVCVLSVVPGGVELPGDPAERLPRLQEPEESVPALLKTSLHDKGVTFLFCHFCSLDCRI